ncbi:MAG: hypothetical protein ACP5JG_03935 [Anaerolineae bacterium]
MTRLRVWRALVSLLVVGSLVLNGVLLYALLYVRGELRSALITARNSLAVKEREPWVVQVNVDQEVPIRTTIPVDETFVIPLDIEYPLSTVINTHVDIPILGRQYINFPVETVIPISYTLEIPIQVDFPISMTYRIQTEVPVEVEMPPEFYGSLNDLIDRMDNELRLNLADGQR